MSLSGHCFAAALIFGRRTQAKREEKHEPILQYKEKVLAHTKIALVSSYIVLNFLTENVTRMVISAGNQKWGQLKKFEIDETFLVSAS